MAAIIETKNLSYSYNKKEAVSNLNIEVPKSSIYGFLGPNGAGKSTTIKLLLGLLKSNEPNVYLFEKELRQNKFEILRKIGCLVESPSLYTHLTAYENLKYFDFIFNVGEQRIIKVLGLVGLWEERNKKVRHFSSGMKQRLGIAISILHNPTILILDEPINGLDPKGVVEVRNLLQVLNHEGITVFISSHILSEIEKLCTHVGIINHGKLIFQGSMSQLLSNSKRIVTIHTDNILSTIEVLSSNFNLEREAENSASFIINSHLDFNNLIYQLVQNHINIFNIETETGCLEDIFINITNN